MIQIIATAQRRHRVFTPAGTFVNIARPDRAHLGIAGLARNPKLVLDSVVVVGFELVLADRPVFQRESFRNEICAVA